LAAAGIAASSTLASTAPSASPAVFDLRLGASGSGRCKNRRKANFCYLTTNRQVSGYGYSH